MRLKQLLGIVLLAMGTASMATAAVSQLGGVLVKNQDSAAVITILANGTFTHTEYRPTDNLMLVDLAGVSIAHPDAKVHAVSAPGVLSYRIAGYRTPDGTEVARMELTLVPGVKVNVAGVEGGLEIRVAGAAAAKPVASSPEKTGPVSRIRDISVARDTDSLNIEISGSGPMTATTMKLVHPDRLVVDIPNSLLQGRAREIAVNSADVKSVRVARFDAGVTRVVLDMAQMRDFQIVPNGNRLVVKLHDGSSTTPATLPETRSSVVAGNTNAAPASKQSNQPETVPAVSASTAIDKTEAKNVEAIPSRAEVAASHFAHAPAPLPASNQPPFAVHGSMAAQPAAINAALQQQQQQPQAMPQAMPQPVQSTSAGTAVAVSSPAGGNCTTGRYTGEPFGMNFKDLDLKDFFRLIHEISGLNVVLDPSVHGSVTIVLDDVPWDQALAIVLDNNGLACTLQGNVLRIATLETMKTEAEARRAQQEAQALAVPKQTFTYYLSYGHAKDAATLVKKFLSARGDVVADDRSNALIIEDIPSVLPKVQDLIRLLDRKAPEVEIEARVVASTRTFARDIGTQLAAGFGSGNNAVGGGLGANSPINVTLPGGQVPRFITGQGAPSTIPLFSNLGASGPTSGIEFSNATAGFRLDFILTAAESRGLLKILSRPTITVQNNISALIRQGSRIPVVTQAQLGGPPTVTYVDAFLRLTVTPQITAENTIFLNIDVENTVPDFSRVSGSQLNPTLNTQQATTQVLVTDGGTVVIGGVIQTQNSVAIAQVPFLGSIPLLGNLFKHTNVNTSTAELIFFITPKIIQT
ncbi:MAG TPA: type IV pilus secretin PilQ [Candidatus Angelobacter sp.]|nr:type IV pilus secretin PilQ [Candidatus Angelobacter sp.]